MTINIRERLKSWLTCTRCGLCKFRRQVVLGRGEVPADILFIGEAPGRSEDLVGEAFVGRAGRILTKGITAAIEMAGRADDPPSFYITNVVACYPTDVQGGDFRPPTREEELACWDRLKMTARLVDPVHVVMLGKVAETACQDRFPGALKLRHPSYILRRGGTNSTEYRTFVRELCDLFTQQSPKELGPRDLFGHRIGKRKSAKVRRKK